MARLIRVEPQVLANHRSSTTAPPTSSSWRAPRPAEPQAVAPWFELTPRAPAVDTRVGHAEGVGVAASLSTFGGLGGVCRDDVGASGSDPLGVVLGGNPTPPGCGPPPDASEFERQCTTRIALLAEDVPAHRQCLLLTAVRGLGPADHATVQAFLGTTWLAEVDVFGEDRIGVLLDLPPAGVFRCELWLRLCGRDRRARLGVIGVSGTLM